MTIAEVGEMSSPEFSEWYAKCQLDGGWGEARADLRAGIIAATIANANRSKGSKAFSPADFMPQLVKDEEPASWEVMKMRAMSLNAAMGGTFK